MKTEQKTAETLFVHMPAELMQRVRKYAKAERKSVNDVLVEWVLKTQAAGQPGRQAEASNAL